MINYTATYTDFYQLTMAQLYFLKGHKNNTAVFDYFFRKLPFEGGYAVFAGLETLLEILENFRFSKEDIQYLKKLGFQEKFISYLESFQFNGNIYSSSEGDVVFPTRPVLQVEANIIEAQILETLLLNILNFQTLIATKAARMRMVAGDKKLIDFGLRRAQASGGLLASRAAIIGGFDSTSNVKAGEIFDIPVSGTMAHSLIQSYDDEYMAFSDFANVYPDNCVLLIDTYDTLKSGLPNAVKVAKEMKKNGKKLKGIRLDSGDLAYLSKECRKVLNENGLEYVKIAASNQLDEYVIRSLIEQKAEIDVFGVGTSLVTGSPDGALDGVYKLAFSNNKPSIKLSESINKITLPNYKQVYRVRNTRKNLILGDVIALKDEEDVNSMYHVFEPGKSLSFKAIEKEALLNPVMKDGKRVNPPKTVKSIQEYSQIRIRELPEEHKRFENPHIYKIGISQGLRNEREKLINKNKK